MSHVTCSPTIVQDLLLLDGLSGVSPDVIHTAEDEAWLAAQSDGGCRVDDLSPEEIAFLTLSHAWEPDPDAGYDAWIDARYEERRDAFIGGFEP
jgi:hypothetical protein